MPPEQAQAWLDGISSLKSRGQANRRGLPGSRSDRAIECSIDLGEGKEMIDSSQLECLRSKSAQVCRFVDSEVKRNLTDFARAAVTATKEEMTSYEWWQPWISLEERRFARWKGASNYLIVGFKNDKLSFIYTGLTIKTLERRQRHLARCRDGAATWDEEQLLYRLAKQCDSIHQLTLAKYPNDNA